MKAMPWSTRLTEVPTRHRRRTLALLTMLLPFAGLLVVEGGLRLVGVGESYSLFVPVRRAEDWVQVNPRVIRRFLTEPQDAPGLWIRPVPFRPEKPPGTFRVFVQGGSSAEGYPYGYGASPAGMLQQRLQRTFPDRRVEVITTAMSAVNSYTLLDFSGEILDHEPDAVVVYAGHNEYLGILGVGSSFSAGRRRPLVLSFLALNDLRLFQLARRLVAAASAGREPQPATRTRRTVMERVVAEDSIPYGSELYRRGLEQYRANLRALLARYREAGVPVFLGTVVSNERDQPPFVSGHGPGVDETAWRRHFITGRRLLGVGEAAVALRELDAAVAVDDLHAETHFWRGRALQALGRFEEAREAYLAAKDRDELRFRAPEAVNEILREVAVAEGGRIVEVREAFARAAENGIVGEDLMLEHLHPNVEGYFVMGDAFYDAFHEAGVIGAWEDPVSEAQARREMPVTEVDRLYGEYRVARLTAGWPFSRGEGSYRLPRPEGPIERIAQGIVQGRHPWPDAMRRLLDHYRSEENLEEASKVAALLADAFPYRLEDQRTAAELLRRVGRPDHRVYRRRLEERQAQLRP